MFGFLYETVLACVSTRGVLERPVSTKPLEWSPKSQWKWNSMCNSDRTGNDIKKGVRCRIGLFDLGGGQTERESLGQVFAPLRRLDPVHQWPVHRLHPVQQCPVHRHYNHSIWKFRQIKLLSFCLVLRFRQKDVRGCDSEGLILQCLHWVVQIHVMLF